MDDIISILLEIFSYAFQLGGKVVSKLYTGVTITDFHF